jgi:predicted CoA-binding protein
VNPAAAEVEGDTCYPNVESVPGGVDAVVVVTTPTAAESVVRDCAKAGVKRVWLHRGVGPSSVSEAAAAFGREHGIQVIAGGCPNMFLPGTDVGHKCMRWWQSLTGALPKDV